ncbi:MAG: YcfL family protein [Pontiellaceae bacterium]|nr:YcfL family protein [Pontiellaceae bacterium]
MKLSRNIIPAAIVMIGLTVAGCKNTSGTIVKTDHETGESTIAAENARLAHHVVVTSTTYDEVNGVKRVNITMASKSNKRLRVDYRISWFDANGMELDPQTKTYRNLILEGHDAVTVTGVANSPAAVSSKLRVRETEQAE